MDEKRSPEPHCAQTKIAGMIDTHLYRMVNASVAGLTNAAAESMNAKIQKVKRLENGYRNMDNFCDAVLFHSGDLDMAFG